MLSIVELVEPSWKNKLWNTCLDGLCRRADAPMMHQGTGPWQQEVQTRIAFMPYRHRQLRELVGESRQENTTNA